MPGLYSKYIKLVHAAGDMLAVGTSLVVAYAIQNEKLVGYFNSHDLILMPYAMLAWFTCTSLLGTYKFYRVSRIITILLNASKAFILYILLIEATLNVTGLNTYSQTYLLAHYIVFICLIWIWRILVISALRVLRRRGYNYRTIIIVGYSKAAKDLKRFFKQHPEYGYRFLGFFDDKNIGKPNVLGNIADVERFVLENNVDEIYCCPFDLDKNQVARLIDFVDNNLIRMKFLPEPGIFPYKNLKIDFYDILPILILRSIPLDDALNKVFKRSFDIAFSLLVIIFILSWLLPLLAIIIKLDSPGSVFFKQERSGIDNKIFKCWKLRTMYVNTDADSIQARRGDARITRFGSFLRKTSLDELPQFFNVLLGNMSVVGPRPHMLKHTQQYAIAVDKFMVRHFVKPGITGLSQVRGFRGDTSEAYQIKGRVKLDIFYLENWSFLLDMKIIYFTVYNMFNGDSSAF
jgi:Undecaprenyl-phosphate glucose phosphotransferase